MTTLRDKQIDRLKRETKKRMTRLTRQRDCGQISSAIFCIKVQEVHQRNVVQLLCADPRAVQEHPMLCQHIVWWYAQAYGNYSPEHFEAIRRYC